MNMQAAKRVATAVAASDDVVCLRLIRDDWMKRWSPLSDSMATELFASLDYNGSGVIETQEIEKELLNRLLQDTEEGQKDQARWTAQTAARSLMRMLDDDEGKYTPNPHRNLTC